MAKKVPTIRPLQELAKLKADDPSWTKHEIDTYIQAEMTTGIFPGERPIEVDLRRDACLDSPYQFACLLDPFYSQEQKGEPCHPQMMDEVMGPWCKGEEVKLDGQYYDPLEYTGLLVLFSRSTYKSTFLRILAQWVSLYWHLRLNKDARVMFVHQVITKAIEHSEAIRTTCRSHKPFRTHFPEFAAKPEGEWDTKAKWRYPCFKNFLTTEWSMTCYGETSSKTGGHYTHRFIDDWVTEESVTTPDQLKQSIDNFVSMDNLRDRGEKNNPWIAVGTNYHFKDTYRHLENTGGWLVWRKPAHTGSPKRIFDIAAINPGESPSARRRIKMLTKKLNEDPPGKLNFPKLLPWEELIRSARSQGPVQYNCQLLLNPVPEGEQRFSPEALEESWVDQIPPKNEVWLYVRVDPAISIKKSADECAIIVGGVKWDRTRWLIDGWIGREKNPSRIVRKIFGYARTWMDKGYTVRNIGVESVSFQESLAELCRQGVAERDAKYHGESVPILKSPVPVRSITRSTDTRKQERILEMDGPISRREMKFWKKCSIAKKVMTQFEEFPMGRDDGLDTVHDLWEGTLTPPRPKLTEMTQYEKDMLDMIQAYENKHGKLKGTSNTVALSNWG